MQIHSWQLQDAKNKLSELIDRASEDIPQLITRRGKPAAYLISAKTWDQLHKPSLKKIIRSCPFPELFGVIGREKETAREIDL